MWKALRHPNVLPFIGAMMAGGQFAMISDWMENGNINTFVKKRPDANRIVLVCLHLESLSVANDCKPSSWKVSLKG